MVLYSISIILIVLLSITIKKSPKVQRNKTEEVIVTSQTSNSVVVGQSKPSYKKSHLKIEIPEQQQEEDNNDILFMKNYYKVYKYVGKLHPFSTNI